MAKIANRLAHFFQREADDALPPLFEDPRLTERLQVSCLLVTLHYERKVQETPPVGSN